MNAPMNVIALNQDQDGRPCGRIVYWNMVGDVRRVDLALALAAESSAQSPPEEPSPVAALRRAAESVAKANGARIHGNRGAWSIVGHASREGDAHTGKKLVYRVSTEATLLGDQAAADGAFAGEVVAAYDNMRTRLSTHDMGAWYTDLVLALGGVALRDNGGFYFLPPFAVPHWEAVTRALAACSGHKLYAIPAMRSTDAVGAILDAIAADAQSTCGKIVDSIANAGKRALESRERDTQAVLSKVEVYENLLGTKLDALRSVIADTRSALSVAMLAIATEDEPE